MEQEAQEFLIDSWSHLAVSRTKALYPDTALSKSGKQIVRLTPVRAELIGFGATQDDLRQVADHIDAEML
jgi:hypothetical protein